MRLLFTSFTRTTSRGQITLHCSLVSALADLVCSCERAFSPSQPPCAFIHISIFFFVFDLSVYLFFSFFFVFLRSLFFSLNVFFTFPLSIFLFFIVLSCELSCFHFIDSNYSLAYSIFFPSLLSLFSSVVLSLHLSISLSWCLYPLFSFLFLSFLSFFLSFSRILQTILPL